MCSGIFQFLIIDRTKIKCLWVLGEAGRFWVNDLVSLSKKHTVLIINSSNLISKRYKMKPWENKMLIVTILIRNYFVITIDESC